MSRQIETMTDTWVKLTENRFRRVYLNQKLGFFLKMIFASKNACIAICGFFTNFKIVEISTYITVYKILFILDIDFKLHR